MEVNVHGHDGGQILIQNGNNKHISVAAIYYILVILSWESLVGGGGGGTP